jgi:hypothetical protein
LTLEKVDARPAGEGSTVSQAERLQARNAFDFWMS